MATYQAVGWNRNKIFYDIWLLIGLIAVAGVYVVASLTGEGANRSIEILVIEALGFCAFLMLNVVLAIGPLARLFPETFLPILYNRRHFGVILFLIAAGHGIFSIVWYHGFGAINPIISAFTTNAPIHSLTDVPFEIFGAVALAILFVMAATSHDFWLNNLGAAFWKAMHMGVYVAYGALVLHVALGARQDSHSPIALFLVLGGAISISTLHVLAGSRASGRAAARAARASSEGWAEAGPPESIPDGRALVLSIDGGERIAVWRSGHRVTATTNVCAHQAGPLGEGCIKDGFITCPWHGFQYDAVTGHAPAPYTERIPTHRVRIEDGLLLVEKRAQSVEKPAQPLVLGENADARR